LWDYYFITKFSEDRIAKVNLASFAWDYTTTCDLNIGESTDDVILGSMWLQNFKALFQNNIDNQWQVEL